MIPSGITIVDDHECPSGKGIYFHCVDGANPVTQRHFLAFVSSLRWMTRRGLKEAAAAATEIAVREELAKWEMEEATQNEGGNTTNPIDPTTRLAI